MKSGIPDQEKEILEIVAQIRRRLNKRPNQDYPDEKTFAAATAAATATTTAKVASSNLPSKVPETISALFIAITQDLAKGRYGEYYDEPNRKLPSGKTLAEETEAEFIKRVLDALRDIATRAQKIHLARNFKNPDLYMSRAKLWEHVKQKKIAEMKFGADEIDTEMVRLAQFDNNSFLSESELRVEAEKNLRAAAQIDPNEIAKEIEKIQQGEQVASMLPGKENDVTLVVMHEFMGYRCKQCGPLSAQGFRDLYGGIEEIASDLPDNLLFEFGTFAVQQEKRVYNTLVAGDNSAMIPIPKAVPSKIDIQYSGAITLYYGEGEFGQRLLQIEEEFRELQSLLEFASKKEEEKIKNKIDAIQKLLLVNDTVRIYSDNLRRVLADFLRGLDEPKDEFTYSYKSQFKHALAEYKKFLAACKETPEAKEDKSTKMAKRSLAFIAEAPTAEGEAGFIMPYGTRKQFRTAGGLVFDMSTEICLDASKNIGRFAKEQQIQAAEMSADVLLPLAMLQTVSSNSIDYRYASGILTANSVIFQADPDRGKDDLRMGVIKLKDVNRVLLQPDVVGETFTTAICRGMVQTTFAPVRVAALRDDLLQRSKISNQLYLDLEAFRQYRAGHAAQLEIVTQMIDRRIQQHFLEELNAISTWSSPAVWGVKSQIISFNEQALLQPKNYRSVMLKYLDQQIEAHRLENSYKDFVRAFTNFRELLLSDGIFVERMVAQSQEQKSKSSLKPLAKNQKPQAEAKLKFFSRQPHTVLRAWFNEGKINKDEYKQAILNSALINLCERDILNLEMFKAIVNQPVVALARGSKHLVPTLYKLILKEILSEPDISFMARHAKSLLLQPAEFAHVLDVINKIGEQGYKELSDSEKQKLFRLDPEICKAWQQDVDSLKIILRAQPEVQEKMHTIDLNGPV